MIHYLLNMKFYITIMGSVHRKLMQQRAREEHKCTEFIDLARYVCIRFKNKTKTRISFVP
jgi:hypothetical protein